jgi:hypothetical protein
VKGPFLAEVAGIPATALRGFLGFFADRVEIDRLADALRRRRKIRRDRTRPPCLVEGPAEGPSRGGRPDDVGREGRCLRSEPEPHEPAHPFALRSGHTMVKMPGSEEGHDLLRDLWSVHDECMTLGQDDEVPHVVEPRALD